MRDTLRGILLSSSIIDYQTRLGLADGRSFEGVISVFNESHDIVRIVSSDSYYGVDGSESVEVSFEDIVSIELVAPRPSNWSL